MNFRDVVEADRRVVGLGWRREQRAEADVVRAFVKRADRLVDAVGDLPTAQSGPTIWRASETGKSS